ncbi:MAG: 16S rRNA (cytosine(967)-C(5))-methyltransferase RsmB [Kangiellaceae bacterium]|nr:16S rRNA (cytosine(967)-C(5))-methyltransferase RsmB [Kangiellaceae bacterium]
MSKNLPSYTITARQQALNWLNLVAINGRSVNEILAHTGEKESGSNKLTDTAFAKQLLFGSLRFYHQIKGIIDLLLEKPLKQKDQDLHSILILGIYQLRYLSVPDHAAISESVELTRAIKKKWAAGLINGCLRNYQRQVDQIEAKLANAKTFINSHPNWIVNQIETDWEQRAEAILLANNQKAPMSIRVNQRVVSRIEYQQLLNEEKLSAVEHPLARDCLVLDTACDVYKLPGFEEGWVTVQDAAAQLVVDLLSPQENDKVLDGCAAPGGKTTHILQRTKQVDLISVEKSENRMLRIQQTLDRLHMDCELKCADILEHDAWWDGELFDKILVDVPCSASGVIRRNPDIKLHRKKLDLVHIVELQKQILTSTWQLLKPGGRLVYATCSIFKDENENQIRDFIEHNEASEILMPEDMKHQMVRHARIGYQILPGEFQMDGFYLCALQKPR